MRRLARLIVLAVVTGALGLGLAATEYHPGHHAAPAAAFRERPHQPVITEGHYWS